MLRAAARAGRRALGRLASLPLRKLGLHNRGRLVQDLLSEMVVEVPVDGGVLRFSASSPGLLWRAEGALAKEPDTIRWIDTFAPGAVFWDVGANVGVFSLYAASRPGVHVVAFEPMAANYAALCGNIVASALSGPIVPYCLALAGTTKLGVLNSFSQEAGTSLHQFGRPGEASRYAEGAVSHAQGVVGYAIDDFIAQFDPPFPTHLKLDVDGIEWPILLGARKTLRDPRLRSVMVELNLNDKDERERAMRLLAESGLVCRLQGTFFSLNGEEAMNHFFERPEPLEETRAAAEPVAAAGASE